MFELEGDYFADRVVAHGYAVERMRLAHGFAVMRNRDELGFVSERADNFSKPNTVGLVERCIYLIEHYKRRWIHGEYRGEKRNRGESSLAAG